MFLDQRVGRSVRPRGLSRALGPNSESTQGIHGPSMITPRRRGGQDGKAVQVKTRAASRVQQYWKAVSSSHGS